MKLIRLVVKGVKGIELVDLTPTDALTTIGGRNGAGKSTAIDCVMYTLGGEKLCPKNPLRDGAEEGEASLDIGPAIGQPADMRVRRRWKKSAAGEVKTVVEVFDLKSVNPTAPQRRPQELIDRFCGRLGLDPSQFIRWSDDGAEGARRQAKTVREVFGLDFTAEDAAEQKAREDRKIINHSLASAEARLSAMPAGDAPDEPVSVAGLMEQLSAAQRHNRGADDLAAQAQKARQLRDADQRTFDAEKERMAELERQLQEARENAEGLSAKIVARNKALARLEDQQKAFVLQDTAALEQQIKEADTVNAKVRAKRARAEVFHEAQTLREALVREERIIAEMQAAKKQKLQAAKLPLPGMGVSEDGITLNGRPLAAACTSEQLRLAIGICVAQKPELPVILMREGAMFDDKSLAEIRQIAEAAGAQVLMEVVTRNEAEDKTVSFVIEEGRVKA